ncbi:poly(U)-specific 3'-to-5' RNA exonuclease [Bonamia ostreae]|uniref:U6 snRNA phosphodiesterase 1 n=1 Tax=Bonamia ostreae TaxID=126728 RepID=A0ABV2AKW8_9EUKA
MRIIKQAFCTFVNEQNQNLRKSFHITKLNEFHISLSETFVLRLHEEDRFVKKLNLETYKKFNKEKIFLDENISFFANSDKSRTFIAIKILHHEFIDQIITKTNKTVSQFRGQIINKKNFRPHVTIGWILGDKTTTLKNTNFNNSFSFKAHVEVKIGKRVFNCNDE